MATPSEILRWVAGSVLDRAPERDEIPSEADLTAWLPGCPDAAQAEANEAAASLALGRAPERDEILSASGLIGTADDTPAVEHWRWQATGDPIAREAAEAALRERIGAALDFDAIMATLESYGAIVERPRLVFAAGLRVQPGEVVHGVFVWELIELHLQWAELPEHDRPRHPVAPLVAAWQRSRPRQVDPERRQDRRILPRIVVGDDPPERRAGMLFGGLHEGRCIARPELPLWPEVASAKRVPLLDLVDAAGLPVMARGKGVPLPLAAFRASTRQRAPRTSQALDRADCADPARAARWIVAERMAHRATLARASRGPDTRAGLRHSRRARPMVSGGAAAHAGCSGNG